MDGWYVRQLLLNRDSIRSNIFEEYPDADKLLINFDDDTYNDLLTAETMFETLYNNGMFTDKEHVISLMFLSGYRINDIAEKLDIHRITVMPTFYNVCAKIAFSLGDYFTNEGFIQRMVDKYNLTEEQIEQVRRIMEK